MTLDRTQQDCLEQTARPLSGSAGKPNVNGRDWKPCIKTISYPARLTKRVKTSIRAKLLNTTAHSTAPRQQTDKGRRPSRALQPQETAEDQNSNLNVGDSFPLWTPPLMRRFKEKFFICYPRSGWKYLCRHAGTLRRTTW